MPIILILLGLMMVLSGARGSHRALGTQFAEDISGRTGFIWWIAALFTLGVIGSYAPLKTFSRALMGLALLSFVLSNRNVFTRVLSELGGSRPKVEAEKLPEAKGSDDSGGGGSGGGSGMGAMAGGAVGGAFFGPVGAMVGSQIGGQIGGQMGGMMG